MLNRLLGIIDGAADACSLFRPGFTESQRHAVVVIQASQPGGRWPQPQRPASRCGFRRQGLLGPHGTLMRTLLSLDHGGGADTLRYLFPVANLPAHTRQSLQRHAPGPLYGPMCAAAPGAPITELKPSAWPWGGGSLSRRTGRSPGRRVARRQT